MYMCTKIKKKKKNTMSPTRKNQHIAHVQRICPKNFPFQKVRYSIRSFLSVDSIVSGRVSISQ